MLIGRVGSKREGKVKICKGYPHDHPPVAVLCTWSNQLPPQVVYVLEKFYSTPEWNHVLVQEAMDSEGILCDLVKFNEPIKLKIKKHLQKVASQQVRAGNAR